MTDKHRFKLTPIGRLVRENGKTIIHLDSRYVRGQQQMTHFSHFRVFWWDATGQDRRYENTDHNPIAFTTVSSIKITAGAIELQESDIPEHASILDIKAYIPMDDRVRECVTRGNTDFAGAISAQTLSGTCLDHTQPFEIESIGKIVQLGSHKQLEMFPRYKKCLEALQGFSHINLIWYFNRFDNPTLRKVLVCNPPYEAPKTGVFASRSPVRPNPLALTVCRIKRLDLEKGELELSGLDALAGTPVIGFKPYIPALDSVETVKVPHWINHWPAWIPEDEAATSEFRIKEADVQNLCYYSREVGEANRPAPPPMVKRPQEPSREDYISVCGARQNNLKNIDVSIPIGKMTVVTGVSGSGKSSLAFDTLYAESQRRYMQSLSAASRMATGQLEKPDVDQVHNLLPAIAIEQKTITQNPRSTVGSVSDVYSFLRLLYARLGIRHCPTCGTEIAPHSVERLIRKLVNLVSGTSINLYPGNDPSTNERLLEMQIPEGKGLDKKMVDQLRQVLTQCYVEGSGYLTVEINHETSIIVTERNICTRCETVLFKMSPSVFSYNSTVGMCPSCNGLGLKMEVDPKKVVTRPDRSLLDEASPWFGNLRRHRAKPNANWFRNEVLALANAMKVDLESPWNDLPEEFKEKALWGTGDEAYEYEYNSGKTGRSGLIKRPVGGAMNHIKRLYTNSKAGNSHETYKQYLAERFCTDCDGERLSADGRYVVLAGKRYPEVASMTIESALHWVESLPAQISENALRMAHNLVDELKTHLQNLIEVGLHYLTLDRSVTTLSGGETQRIKLAGQLGCGLSGLLYVLDEPSIGLHPSDHQKMIQTMLKLRDTGNTVVVVEHDEDTMLAADHIIDVGPGAGANGGNIVAQGSPSEIMYNPKSVTGPFLSSGNSLRADLGKPGEHQGPFLKIKGATLHNLKDIEASFPVGQVSCVTGVSGSGKSSLIRGTLVPALIRKLNGIDAQAGHYSQLSGLEHVDKIISVDQSSIGRSPRSIPATYIGVFDDIRSLFAGTDAAKQLKYKVNRFSFNDKSGRCPTCEGLGKIKVDMNFLPDTWITCSDCDGKRYQPEILEITYNNRNISDVLTMDVAEALLFFRNSQKVVTYLKTMADVGLDYLKLGQHSATLSGGEAQRIKLAKELSRQDTGKTLYVLDEPTSGLHRSDIEKLLKVLHRLAEMGNTVIIVEHNLHVIETSHWIVDLGPTGGDAGGYLIAQGSPAQIMKNRSSITGRVLGRTV